MTRPKDPSRSILAPGRGERRSRKTTNDSDLSRSAACFVQKKWTTANRQQAAGVLFYHDCCSKRRSRFHAMTRIEVGATTRPAPLAILSTVGCTLARDIPPPPPPPHPGDKCRSVVLHTQKRNTMRRPEKQTQRKPQPLWDFRTEEVSKNSDDYSIGAKKHSPGCWDRCLRSAASTGVTALAQRIGTRISASSSSPVDKTFLLVLQVTMLLPGPLKGLPAGVDTKLIFLINTSQ